MVYVLDNFSTMYDVFVQRFVLFEMQCIQSTYANLIYTLESGRNALVSNIKRVAYLYINTVILFKRYNMYIYHIYFFNLKHSRLI